MSKFTFKCEHYDFTGRHESTNTMEFEKEHLATVVEQFEQFLKGCGYSFGGNLQIVDDFECEKELAVHSEFFYDTTRNR